MNPFEIFGLTPAFDVDLDRLERVSFDLLKRVHPDRFATASAADRLAAEQWTVRIRDAYETLKDPVKRAEQLLLMKGYPVNLDSSQGIEEDFLMRQLERRESIEEAAAAHDAEALTRLQAEVLAEKQALLGHLAHLLAEPGQEEAASVEVRKILFLNRQLQDLAQCL